MKTLTKPVTRTPAPPRKWTDEVTMTNLMMQHARTGRVACPECNRQFMTMNGLSDHRLHKHQTGAVDPQAPSTLTMRTINQWYAAYKRRGVRP